MPRRAGNQERVHAHLSRRERQIMDALYASEEASAAEVQGRIPNPPSYSAVRALLAKLVEKGHVEFRQQGPRYLYRATLEKSAASRNAWQRLLDTFFSGSTADAVVSLLGREGDRLSADEIDAIERKLTELKDRRSSGQRTAKERSD
jgi:predicted transcriptional regulator